MILNINNLTKSYKEGYNGQSPAHRVLDDVTFSVASGEFIALRGASGSGKTTLLNLIGGLDVPDSGRVEVAGQDIALMSDDGRSEWRLHSIGFVFQFFNLIGNLTVTENIALPLLFQDTPDRKARERAHALADEVALGDKVDRFVNQLSGGEMQRVAIARALVHEPGVVLADEPTGNLDSTTGHVILDLLKAASKRHGATVVMATHDHKCADYCDRTLEMTDGRLMKTEAP